MLDKSPLSESIDTYQPSASVGNDIPLSMQQLQLGQPRPVAIHAGGMAESIRSTGSLQATNSVQGIGSIAPFSVARNNEGETHA